MSPLKRSSNISSRMGRWSARHRKTAIFGWLAFVVAAVVIGGALGTKQLGNNDTLPGESGRATKILDEGFKQPAGETVLVQSRSSTADDPAFRAAVADVVRRLSAVSVVTNIRGPYAVGNPGQISADGHSAVVNLDVTGRRGHRRRPDRPGAEGRRRVCRGAPLAAGRGVRGQR